MADPGRLAQVVLNLIVNAIHAMPDGDVAGNELRIATSAAAGRVRIAVSDTGPGIAPAVAAHLFEPFVTSKPPGIGTGLGLYISRNIVLAMNGSLTVDSVPGRGATFLVELPAAATAAPEPSAPRAVARRPLPPARILVVDDERAIRELMRDALAGHQVETAASGREAIAALEQSPFDLVFCDLIMPDLTGMDVYEHARASAPSGPAQFVFMTGAAFTAAARAFLRDTSRPVLHKPFDEAAIVDTVERALTRSP
jgi:CheY-like chemotaxis protein/anti-sigma regulatory factor (Ser/Thr protein kinase)